MVIFNQIRKLKIFYCRNCRQEIISKIHHCSQNKIHHIYDGTCYPTFSGYSPTSLALTRKLNDLLYCKYANVNANDLNDEDIALLNNYSSYKQIMKYINMNHVFYHHLYKLNKQSNQYVLDKNKINAINAMMTEEITTNQTSCTMIIKMQENKSNKEISSFIKASQFFKNHNQK